MPKPKCFCGCGQDVGRFPLFIRSANNLGRDVTERLAYTQEILGDLIYHPTWARWDADGEAHIEALRNAIHHHTPILQNELQRWMVAGRQIEQAFIGMGAPPIVAWLQTPDKLRASQAYIDRLNEIRAILTRTASEGEG